MFTIKTNKCPRCTMRKKCIWHKNVLGFNLIQLVIVIAIAAILTVAILLNEDPLARIGKAKDAERLQEVQSIARALELYGLDNGSIPTDFASSTLGVGETFVLCSTGGTATCDDQTRSCLVIDDPNYLKFLNSLPIDPEKTNTADTGYYISRTASNAIKIGACDTYTEGLDISVVSKTTLAPQIGCGNGVVEAAEVCDDGNNFYEGCGNASIEIAGTYCNPNCTATIVIGADEVCDSVQLDACWDEVLRQDFYAEDYVRGDKDCPTKALCNRWCDTCLLYCRAPSP